MKQTVQWQGDNAPEIEKLLTTYVARADKDGDRLHIVGLGGLDVWLKLGDSLIVEPDRLGVMRTSEQPVIEPWVTWDGNNLQKVVNFVADYEINFSVIGADIYLYGADMAVLKRGDRLIKRHGQLIVSKAGRDYRM